MQDRYNNAVGDWTGLGGSLIGGAGTYFGSVEQRKAQQAQADALIAQGKSQVEVAKIMQETERLKLAQQQSGAGASSGAGSKTLYIALGVGAVVVLGVVIFAVTRKK
jgi:hypothetical protein